LADVLAMMARILTPEPAMAPPAQTDPDEYEIVLGSRQMASLGFLVLVLIAAAAGGAYLFGKAVTRRAPSASLPVVQAAPLPTPVATVPEPALAAPIPPPVAIEKPLFAEPAQGIIYIQMGAVEKGIAEIFAEGLRKRGFNSFVASGPSERIFRVLVGPFRNAEEYDAAKKSLDRIGLDTFARRYQQSSSTTPSDPAVK
jgi:hypothetical protein